MSTPKCEHCGGRSNWRHERVKRLLDELRYEIVRGLAEGDITDEIHMRYVAPLIAGKFDKAGIIRFSLRISAVHAGVIQDLYSA